MKYICSQCCQEKEKEEFGKSSNIKRGFDYHCKECEHERYKRKKAKDPEAHNLRAKLWARKRISEDPEYGKKYYQKNKERIKEYKNKNREKNKDKINARTRLNLYLLKGYIQKPDICSRCKEKCDRIEAHHEDYTKSLDVIWLCPPCHILADKEKKKRDDKIMYEYLKSQM